MNNQELVNRYITMRHDALVLRDAGGYDLGKGEMNPVIFEELVDRVFSGTIMPVVWEPFAGRTARSKMMDYAVENNIYLLSQTLNPADPRIATADSCVSGPEMTVGAVLFHPPYFGSAPVDAKDVCSAKGKDPYMARLRMVVSMFLNGRFQIPNGLVCAVGRDYHIDKRRIRLDHWYLELFDPERFVLEEVWISEPDVSLLFRIVK